MRHDLWTRIVSLVLMVTITVSTYASLYGMAFGYSKQMYIREQLGSHLETVVDLDNVVDYTWDEKNGNTLKFELIDGSTTVYTFSEDVLYREDGIVKGKDMSIAAQDKKGLEELGYDYSMAHNDYDVNFSTDISKGIKVLNDNYGYSLIPVTQNKVNAVGELIVEDKTDVFRYKNAFSNTTTIKYYPQLNGLKEEIVLDKYANQNTFQFTLELKNCHPKLADDGSLVLYQTEKDKENKETQNTVETFSPIFAYDAASDGEHDGIHYTDDCKYKLEKIDDDTYTLSLIVSKEWLEADTTVYPVIIDPVTANISNMKDAPIYEDYPFSGGCADKTNEVGHTSGYETARSLICFEIPSSITAGAVINEAKYWTYQVSGGTTSKDIALHLVTSNWSEDVEWDTAPSFESNYFTVKTVGGRTTADSGSKWFAFDVKTAVERWLSGTPNYGFLMKYNTETTTLGSKSFANREYRTSSYLPYSVINYTVDGAPPTYQSVTGNSSDWQTGSVSLTVNGAADADSGLHTNAYSFSTSAGVYNWQASNVSPAYTEHQTVYVYIRDASGNITSCGSYEIKVDNDAPTAIGVTHNPSSWTSDGVALAVTGAEDSGVGLHTSPYSFSTQQGVYDWQSTPSKVISENGTVYVYLRDALENIVLYETHTVNNIDKEAPTILGYSQEKIDTDEYILTVTATDGEGSGIKEYSFDNGTTWQEGNSKTVASFDGVAIKVKDNVGNIGVYESMEPNGLRAEEVCDDEIVLAWNAPAGEASVTGYNVYQNNQLIGTTENTTYIVSNLINGTNYSFFVKAIGFNETLSVASNTITVTTGLETISDIDVVAGIKSIQISWAPCYGVTEYDVKIDDTLYEGVTETTYTFTGLSVNSTHTIQVRPVKGEITGAFSNALIVTTQNATMVSGTISSNTTWTVANSPYLVTGDVTVSSGVTLTVEPGVVVFFNSGCGLIVNGNLLADGTTSLPIVFTCEDDPEYAGAEGFYWDGITVNSTGTATIDNAVVRYANNGEDTATSLYSAGTISVTNSTFAYCDSMAPVWVTGTSVITGNDIDVSLVNYSGIIVANAEDNNITISSNNISTQAGESFNASGIYLAGYLGGDLIIQNNTVDENLLISAIVDLNYFTPDSLTGFESNTFSGLVDLFGALKTNWSLPEYNYFIDSNITVPSGKTLTFNGGSIIYVRPDVSINVEGTLNSIGTSDKPIYFTDLTMTKQAAGDDNDYWNGFNVTSTGTLDLDYTAIMYAGGDIDENAIYSCGNVDVNESAILYSNGNGIYLFEDNTEILKTVNIKATEFDETNCAIACDILGGVNLVVQNNLITDSATYGIHFVNYAGPGSNMADDTVPEEEKQLYSGATITLQNNVISNSGQYAWYSETQFCPQEIVGLATNSFTDVLKFDCLYVISSMTLSANAYLIGKVVVHSAGTLNVSPGTVIDNTNGMYVAGVLNMIGEPTQKIVVRGTWDVTQGVAATSAKSILSESGQMTFKHVRIKNYDLAIYSTASSSLNMTYSSVVDSASVVYFENHLSTVLNYNTFANIHYSTINCSQMVGTADISHNYWGSSDGPRILRVYEDSDGNTVEQVLKDSSGSEIWLSTSSTTLTVADGEIADTAGNKIIYGPYYGEDLNYRTHFGESGVYAPTGGFSQQFTDMSITSNALMSFDAVRTYNSRDSRTNTAFGTGWSFNFESEVSDYSIVTLDDEGEVVSTDVDTTLKIVRLPDGSVFSFDANDDGTFTARDSRNTLEKVSEKFVLTTSEQVVYSYNEDNKLQYIDDPYGNRTTVSYDSDGKITAITDCTGRVLNITYTGTHIAKIEDSVNSKSVSYAYDVSGKLITVTTVSGATCEYVYDAKGLLTEIYDENDTRIAKVTYNHTDGQNLNKVTSILDSTGNLYVYTYDNLNRTVTITDSNDKVIVQKYDESFYLTEETDADENTANLVYPENNVYGEPISITDRNGNTIAFEYDENGNVIKSTYPDGSTIEMEYDANNNVTYRKDQSGNKTFYFYDSNNNLLKEVKPLNGTDVYKNDGTDTDDDFAIKSYTYVTSGTTINGLVATETDENGIVTSFTYDSSGNKISETLNGKTASYEYDTSGNLTKEITPSGVITQYVYDDANNQIKEIVGDNYVTRTVYDVSGNVVMEISPRQYDSSKEGDNYAYNADVGTRYTYDANGNVLTEKDALGNVTTYTYDNYGNVLTETTPLGAVYRYTYDNIHRVTNEYYKESETATEILLKSYEYAILEGGKTRTTTNVYTNDSLYLSSSVVYDYAGREIQVINADGTSKYTEYFADGSVKSTTDELGHKTYYQYDALGRQTGKWVAVSETEYAYSGTEYDKGGRTLKTHQGKSYVDLYEIPEETVVVSFEYNAEGNISSQTNALGGKTVYSYDNDGNMTKQESYVTDTEKVTTEYEYDYAGRTTKVINHVQKGELYGNDFTDTESTTLVAISAYDANGNLISTTDPSGNVETYTYDLLDRELTKTVSLVDENGGIVTATNSKTYDAEGNVLTDTDYNGNVTTNVYDGRGQVVRIIDANGGPTAYYYDYAGRQTAVVSAKNYDSTKSLSNMTRTEYTYDQMGRSIATTQYYWDASTGVMLNFVESSTTYDAAGRSIKQQDALGNAYEYTYDYAGKVLTELDPVSKDMGLSATMSYSYDALCRKILSVDANGNKHAYTYDDGGNLLTETVIANGEEYGITVKSSQYDYLSRLVSETDGNGNTTNYEYNGAGQVKKTTKAGDSTISDYVTYVQYNGTGTVGATWDSEGKKTTYTYDAMGRKLSEIVSDLNGNSAITLTYRYDKSGNLKKYIDGNGNETTFTYDKSGRKLTETVNGKTKTYTYDLNGNLLTETDAFGNTTTNVYDDLNRLIQKKNADNVVIETLTYDNASRQLTSVDALNNTTSFGYDKNGRLISTIDPENHYETKAYDGAGNLVSVTDKNGNTTAYTYDEFGRLTAVTDALEEVTYYTYDNNGNMISQMDAKGNVTNYEYNALGLRTKIIAPQGRTGTSGNYSYVSTKVETYTYSPNGNLVSKTDKNGNTTNYTYDVHGRLLSSVCGNLLVTYTYDNNGNVLTMTDSTGTTTKTYDSENRILTKTVPEIGTVSYSYDQIDGVTSGYNFVTVTYPNAAVVKKVYDNIGRLSQVIADSKTIQYNYYANGSVQSVVYNNGAREDYTYNPDNTLATLINKNTDGTILESYTYAYDNANNRLTTVDSEGTTTYTYDALGRLLTETLPTGRITSYGYDGVGNRVAQDVLENGVSTFTTYTYDDQNRLTAIEKSQNDIVVETTAYTYDYNGNNLTKSISTHSGGELQSTTTVLTNTYDNWNQLVQSVTGDNKTIINTYNGDGYRVEKQVVNGNTTKYLYDGDKVIAEYYDDNSTKAINVYGLNLVFRFGASSSDYYMYNGHADVTALIDASTNAVTATYYYDAFGNILEQTGSTTNTILYAGYQYDAETGLYYLNARMYDPVIARFLQEDTYRGDAKDPLSLNLYVYCKSNPIIYYDPSGHQGLFLTGLADFYIDYDMTRFFLDCLPVKSKEILLNKWYSSSEIKGILTEEEIAFEVAYAHGLDFSTSRSLHVAEIGGPDGWGFDITVSVTGGYTSKSVVKFVYGIGEAGISIGYVGVGHKGDYTYYSTSVPTPDKNVNMSSLVGGKLSGMMYEVGYISESSKLGVYAAVTVCFELSYIALAAAGVATYAVANLAPAALAGAATKVVGGSAPTFVPMLNAIFVSPHMLYTIMNSIILPMYC